MQTRPHIMTINQHLTRVFCPQLIRNVRTVGRTDISSIIVHPVNFYTVGGVAESMMPISPFISLYWYNPLYMGIWVYTYRCNFSHTPEVHGIPWNSMKLLIFPNKVPWNSMELFLKFHWIPWNSMELDKLDILNNHISKYCCWYLIDYMLFRYNLTETLHIPLISIS